MKPVSPRTEKNFDQDMKTFEKLAAQTKELVILKDRVEKAIGQESVALNKKIQTQSTQRASRPQRGRR